jgi:hypothetical protein
MNWRRRLWQLWAVFTVIWVAGATFEGVRAYQGRPATYDLTNPHGVVYSVTGASGITRDQITTDVQALYGDATPSRECSAQKPPKWCASAIVAHPMPRTPPKPNLWGALAWAFLVPLGLLLIGCTAVWLRHGIRRKA